MTAARRLAAILAADVVGYSRLMGEGEAGTARAVREHRQAAHPITLIANYGFPPTATSTVKPRARNQSMWNSPLPRKDSISTQAAKVTSADDVQYGEERL